MNKQVQDSELNLKKLFETINNYKGLILLFMFTSSILMFINLYFKPSIYNSNAIIEIKSKSKPKMPNDFLLGALSFGSAGKVEKEMELLKTFLINNKALEKINLNTRYFKTKGYRDIELYAKDIPISISKIKIYNPFIIGKKFTLHPYKNYFTLSIQNSLSDSLFKFLSSKSYIDLDTNKKYSYNTEIKNSYFKLTIKKNLLINQAIKFTLCGTNRYVYDKIINKNLSITQINPSAPLIKISYEDSVPQRSNNYVNALISSFIEESIDTKNEQNNNVLSFIKKQLDELRNKLKISENKLETYKVSNHVISPSVQAKTYIKKLSEIEIKLSENILQQKLVSSILSFVKHNKNLDSIAPSLMELNDKPTLQLITSLQNLQLKQDDLKAELTSQHPKLITLRKQINLIRKKIIYNIENLKSLIKQRSISVKNERKSYENKIRKLPVKEKNLVNLKRDYEVSSTMYNYLLKKKTESELLIVSTLSDYKIIDKAHTMNEPIKPKRTLMMIVAVLIGLFFGIIVATILEAFNSKIKNKEELENLTDYPLLGIIPSINKKQIALEVYTNPDSPFTESYRSLRANLPIKTKGLAKIILVTSTIANEGKTTVTSNLASVFQMAGHKCIILNFDLRKPTLHNYFNLKSDRGLSRYLNGEDSIQDIIFATKHTNLHVITSGPIPHNPAELILSNKLPELLALLKTRYDYIFIDSAPIGLVSDSIPLMKLADQNLLVFRENYAEKSFLLSMNDIIQKNQLNNIGLILNRSKSKTNSYGYGYGYGYGK